MTDSTQPSDGGRAEEPDFDEDDEAAMDRVWARIHAGETLDEIVGPTPVNDSEDEDDEEPDVEPD